VVPESTHASPGVVPGVQQSGGPVVLLYVLFCCNDTLCCAVLCYAAALCVHRHAVLCCAVQYHSGRSCYTSDRQLAALEPCGVMECDQDCIAPQQQQQQRGSSGGSSGGSSDCKVGGAINGGLTKRGRVCVAAAHI